MLGACGPAETLAMRVSAAESAKEFDTSVDIDLTDAYCRPLCVCVCVWERVCVCVWYVCDVCMCVWCACVCTVIQVPAFTPASRQCSVASHNHVASRWHGHVQGLIDQIMWQSQLRKSDVNFPVENTHTKLVGKTSQLTAQSIVSAQKVIGPHRKSLWRMDDNSLACECKGTSQFKTCFAQLWGQIRAKKRRNERILQWTSLLFYTEITIMIIIIISFYPCVWCPLAMLWPNVKEAVVCDSSMWQMHYDTWQHFCPSCSTNRHPQTHFLSLILINSAF